jgi:hypothetical protein
MGEIIPVILGFYILYRIFTFLGSFGSKFQGNNKNNIIQSDNDLDNLFEVEKSLGEYITTLNFLSLPWLVTFFGENDKYLKLFNAINVYYKVHENQNVNHSLNHQIECVKLHKKVLDDFKMLIKVTQASSLAHYEVSDNDEKDIINPYKELSETAKLDLIDMFDNIYEEFFLNIIPLSEDYHCDLCLNEYVRLYQEL